MSRRRSLRRWVAVLATGTALAVAPASLASAHGYGVRAHHADRFDDAAVAEVTTPGRQASSRLAYHHSPARSVTATNAAVAHATCDGCRAVALSFQVVVADGGPRDLDVANAAVALTENCEGCVAVAVAYQLVVAGDQPLRLTARGRQSLLQLRWQLRALSRSDLPADELQTRADALVQQLTTAMTQELRAQVRVRCDRDKEQRPWRPVHHRHPPGHPGPRPVDARAS